MRGGGRCHTPLVISACHGAWERWSGRPLMCERKRMLMLDNMFGSVNFIKAASSPTYILRKRSSAFIVEKWLFSAHTINWVKLERTTSVAVGEPGRTEAPFLKRQFLLNHGLHFNPWLYHFVLSLDLGVRFEVLSFSYNFLGKKKKWNLTIFRGTGFRMILIGFLSSFHCVKSCLLSVLCLDNRAL